MKDAAVQLNGTNGILASHLNFGDPKRGWDSVTVPGAIAGWAALHERFGRLPFEQCLQPAIEYAVRGYGVSTIVKRKWDAHVGTLAKEPGQIGWADHFTILIARANWFAARLDRIAVDESPRHAETDLRNAR